MNLEGITVKQPLVLSQELETQFLDLMQLSQQGPAFVFRSASRACVAVGVPECSCLYVASQRTACGAY